MGSSRFRPSPALAISLIALFVSIGGVSYAASQIGTNEIQDRAVTASKLHRHAVTRQKVDGAAINGAKVEDDSLTGDDIQASTLGQVPSAKNADTANNASTLDGLDSTAFEAKGDIVRINAPSLSFGAAQSWDIGPVITLIAECSTSGCTNHLTVHLLNNTPSSGQWILGDLIYPGDKPQLNPATAWTRSGVIQSGQTDLVTESVNPPSTTSHFETASHNATVTWWDQSGELRRVRIPELLLDRGDLHTRDLTLVRPCCRPCSSGWGRYCVPVLSRSGSIRRRSGSPV